jgi:penicillin-binding protein 1C
LLKKILIMAVLLIAGLLLLDKLNPIPDPLSSPSLVVTAQDGQVLRRFSNSDGILREQINQDQVSPFYLQSLLAYEDKWFYYHPGINPFSLVRAAWQWFSQGQVISGGSTITMQVARLLNPHQRTILGKASQMLRALQLEYHLDKQEILTLYINLAPFGGNIEGIQAASRKYFAKTALELTFNEAALLVVLPQRPSLYRPDRYLDNAIAARNKVLQRLQQDAILSTETLQRLVNEPISLAPLKNYLHSPLLARRLVNYHRLSSSLLKSRLLNTAQSQTAGPQTAGLQTAARQTTLSQSANSQSGIITTTIDYQLQSELESYLQNKKATLSPEQSTAVLVLNNHTHEVIAYRGSLDLFDPQRHGFVDMVQRIRSPGSTLKPFVYGMALDKGLIHEQSLLTDVPRNFNGYAPHNFDRRYHGAVSAAEALQLSLNIPAVQVLSHLGADTFADALRQIGLLDDDTEANLSLALGGFGTNLFQLTRLYSALANQGQVYPVYFEPQAATEQASSQQLLSSQALQSHQTLHSPQIMLSPQASWIIWQILARQSESSNFNTGTYRQVAWKTGTSYGFRDAWSIGVSADYTVGVWLGRPDGAPSIGSYGAKDATPIMFDLFALLPADETKILRPDNIEKTVICWPSGYARSLTEPRLCEQQRETWSIAGKTPPTLYANFSDHGWPQEIVKWRASRAQSDRTESKDKPVHIIGLENNATLFSYPGQVMHLKATLTGVNWYVNDKLLGANQLSLDEFQQDNLRITACLKQTIQCDTVQITIN